MASKKINQRINKFRDDILSGELPYGYLLPSEKQLAESMLLSRPTVAKIYDALRKEGLIQEKARDYLMRLPARLMRLTERITIPENSFQFKWVEPAKL